MHVNIVFVCTFVCISVCVRCSFPHCMTNRKVPSCVVYVRFLLILAYVKPSRTPQRRGPRWSGRSQKYRTLLFVMRSSDRI